jgi:hypothetical protein
MTTLKINKKLLENSKDANSNSNTIIASEKKYSEFYESIEWTDDNKKQKNFNAYPILLSWSYKFFNKKINNYDYSYKFLGFNDWNAAAKFVKSRRCIYEDFLVCKGFLDMEWYVLIGEYEMNKDKYDADAISRAKIMIIYIRRAMHKLLSDNGFDDKNFDIMVAKSHGIVKNGTQYKFSFHFVVNSKYRFKNSRDAIQLPNIIHAISENPEITKYIDLSVYKKSPTAKQKFRCLYSPKTEDDNRILEPLDEDCNVIPEQNINIFDYLVGYNEGNDLKYFSSLPEQNIDNTTKKTKTKNSRKNKSSNNQPTISAGNSADKSTKKASNNDTVNDTVNDADDDTDTKLMDGIVDEAPDDVLEDTVDNNATDKSQNEMIENNHNRNDQKLSRREVNRRNEQIKNRRLVLDKLRTIIPSAYIESVTIDKESKITFYRYNYLHKEDGCVHKNKTHERNGGYAYIKDQSAVYAGCYSSKCEGHGAINIGNILEESYWTKHKDHITIDSSYIRHNATVKKEIKSFVESSNRQIFPVISKTATGKTKMSAYLLEKYIKHKKNPRILLISTRRTYADDVENNVFNLMNFSNYMKINDNEMKYHDRLIISLESLHKLFDQTVSELSEPVSSICTYDMIILDEIETIMTQLFSKTIERKLGTFNLLQMLLDAADKIVALDADLDNRSMCLLNSLGINHRPIYNIYKKPPRKYKMVNDYLKYMDAIINDVKNGKNVCVVSLSQNVGLDIRKRLHKLFPDIVDQIVCIHKDADKNLLGTLKNVNVEWKKFRVLIYTPIIGCGINFEIKKHFSQVYSYLVGNVESPRILLQMIDRIRHPQITDVTIMMSPKPSKRTNAQLYSFEYASKYCNASDLEIDKSNPSTIVVFDKNGRKTIVKKYVLNTWNQLRAYYLQEFRLNNTNGNMLTALKSLIDIRGDIFEMSLSKVVTKVDIKKNVDRVIEAPLINKEERKTIIDNNNFSEEDHYKLEKWKLRRELNFKEDVDNDKLNESIRTYTESEDIIKRIIAYYAQEFKNNSNKNNKFKPPKFEEEINDETTTQNVLFNLFKKIITLLNFNLNFENVNDEIKYDKEQFENIIGNMTMSREEIKSVCSRGKTSKILENSNQIEEKLFDEKYVMIKIILSRFGIIVEKKHEKLREGKRVHSLVNGYKFSYNKCVYDIVRCKLHYKKNKYERKFIQFLNKFDTYKNCLENDPARQLANSPNLFINFKQK